MAKRSNKRVNTQAGKSRFARQARPQVTSTSGNRGKQVDGYGPNHPINNAANNEKLCKHIRERLDFANEQRANQINRYAAIDTEISGFIVQDRKDQQRERDNRMGRGPKPTLTNLELVKTQLDEAVTYLMGVFAPDSGLFEAIASDEKQAIAKAFALKLNMDGDRKQYYRHYAKAFLDMLKYNFGGWLVTWEQQRGTKLQPSTDRTNIEIKKNQVVWEGNRIQSIDPYNALWDKSIMACDIAEYGEFFALVDVHRNFRVKKMEADGEIFGIDRFIKTSSGMQLKYYQKKPTLRLDINVDQRVGRSETDWVSWFSAGGTNEVQSGIETVHYFGWLNPTDFGLSDSDTLEIWCITMMANHYVVSANKMENAHGLLPFAVATPNDDGLDTQTRSYGETLIPLQRFASHLFNVHVESSRKSLYGITFYDPTVIPFNEYPDDVAAKIPIKPKGYGKPLKEHVYQVFDAPNTDKTIEHFKGVLEVMQKVLPTDILKQVASLERATSYQAAATVQGGNRRCQKLAKMIEDMAMKKVRFMVMYNIFEKQTTIKMMGPDGSDQDINPIDFVDANIEFVVSDGLKGIDKLQIIEGYKEILNVMIQNRDAMQEYDIVEFLNYISSLLGDRTDLTQFKQKTIWNQLPPEVQEVVSQLIQSGKLNGIIQEGVQQLQQNQQNASGGQQMPMKPAGQTGNVPAPQGNGAAPPSMPSPTGGQLPPPTDGGQVPPGVGP